MVRTGANRDNEHPDAVVQNADVSIGFDLYVSALIMNVRKKAGAVRTESNGGSGTAGMTDAMKERAKEALLGRTGDTNDEDDL